MTSVISSSTPSSTSSRLPNSSRQRSTAASTSCRSSALEDCCSKSDRHMGAYKSTQVRSSLGRLLWCFRVPAGPTSVTNVVRLAPGDTVGWGVRAQQWGHRPSGAPGHSHWRGPGASGGIHRWGTTHRVRRTRFGGCALGYRRVAGGGCATAPRGRERESCKHR